MDELRHQPGIISVSKGVKYDSHISEDLELMREKMASKGSPALQYSAYYTVRDDDRGVCNFMLGWDHAMILVRRDEGWFVHSVYSAKYAPAGSAEGKVWKISHRGDTVPLSDAERMLIPGAKPEGQRTWHGFNLEGENVAVAHVMTLGLTSCSFACLFDDDHIIISHMSSKTIPVAWLATTVLELDDTTPLKLLVSHHGDPTEYDKYVTTAGMPCADQLCIDSILCSRGVKHLPVELGTFTPSLSHPYMGLNLQNPDRVTCFSVLGYNNDPGLHVEQPPLHIVWPLFFQKLCNTTDAQLVIDILADCHQGNYGFDELYDLLFAELVAEHSRYKIETGEDFTSTLITQMLGDLEPTKKWTLSGRVPVAPKAKLPDPLRGWAQVVFLMIDVVQHLAAEGGPYKRFTLALLRAWDKYQKGFSFDLSQWDAFVIPAPKDRTVPKHKTYQA